MEHYSLHRLYIHDMQDAFSAEVQLATALPRIIHEVNDLELKQALSDHLGETQVHVSMVKSIIEKYDESPGGHPCLGMKGLVEECEQTINEIEMGAVRDAALIAACQKMEHYEIAAYGTLRVFANHLGYSGDRSILAEILGQEFKTDMRLTAIAEGSVNQLAESTI